MVGANFYAFCNYDVFPSTAFIHRSVIFNHSREGNHRQLEDMFSACRRPKSARRLELMVNRANYEGDTPLHCSTKEGNTECTRVLLKYGAIPRENSEGKIPLIGNLLNDEGVLKKLIEAKQNKQLSSFCMRSLKKQVPDEERSTLLSLQGVGADYGAKKNFVLREYNQENRRFSEAIMHVQSGQQLEVSVF